MSIGNVSLIRVVKLGGSLLSWPNWSHAFQNWYDRQSSMKTIVVVGGGSRVEQLRKLDKRLGLGQFACHEIAIRFMTVNAHFVAAELAAPLVSNSMIPPDSLGVLDMGRFDARNLLTDRDGRHLPKHWDVTSDSLSASVARALNATELVLLKSAQSPQRERWTASGFVDPIFERAAPKDIEIKAVNLRDDCFANPLPVSQSRL